MSERGGAVGRPRIAVIGGTGALGSGLAARWARAGYPVVIGSRNAERAAAAAAAITDAAGGAQVRVLEQAQAAAMAEIVVLAIPFAAHGATLDAIRGQVRGKIVVDTTVPLVAPKVGTVQIPAEGCAAVQAERRLGGEAIVVSAFHNISAVWLAGAAPIACDVLVFGDKRAAREEVIRLVEAVGLRGLHGGPLVNSIAAEALTSVLITINRLYKIEGAGIRIIGPGSEGGEA